MYNSLEYTYFSNAFFAIFFIYCTANKYYRYSTGYRYEFLFFVLWKWELYFKRNIFFILYDGLCIRKLVSMVSVSHRTETCLGRYITKLNSLTTFILLLHPTHTEFHQNLSNSWRGKLAWPPTYTFILCTLWKLYSMEHSPSWEAKCCSDGQEMPCL
jgi:hypothetical protein